VRPWILAPSGNLHAGLKRRDAAVHQIAAPKTDRVFTPAASTSPGPVQPASSAAGRGHGPPRRDRASRVITSLLEEPVADRCNWTIPRLRGEVEARDGVRISQISKALHKRVPLAAAAAHAEGPPGRRRGRTGRPALATAKNSRRKPAISFSSSAMRARR
jgi:hypothetical protein